MTGTSPLKELGGQLVIVNLQTDHSYENHSQRVDHTLTSQRCRMYLRDD